MIVWVICRKRGVLLHGLLSTLTAGLLSFHIAVGCCWHHGHTCVAPTPTADRCATESTKATCCEHRHASNPLENSLSGDAEDQHPAPEQHCDGPKCQFVNSEGPQPPNVADFLSVPVYLTADVVDSLGAQGAVRAAVAPIPAAPPGVRLHLLHGLLLI